MSDLIQFYKGKNIFITGGSGFLGLALIEKILRCCHDVSTVKRNTETLIFFHNETKKNYQTNEMSLLTLQVMIKINYLLKNLNKTR